MGTKNYNVRFRENKADEERAWERLHSEEVSIERGQVTQIEKKHGKCYFIDIGGI